jgi:hypothetical protein
MTSYILTIDDTLPVAKPAKARFQIDGKFLLRLAIWTAGIALVSLCTVLKRSGQRLAALPGPRVSAATLLVTAVSALAICACLGMQMP